MISLIIPTLNEAASLKRTLADLTPELRSKYQVQLIISDGGSTDNTIKVAKDFGARVVEPKVGEKQNIAIGRNAGAVLAQGDVLIFLDADSKPKSWAKLFESASNILADSKVVAATVSVEIYPEERKWRDLVWQNLFNLVFFAENVVGIAMGRGNCQIVKAEAFRRIGGYNVNLAAAEDYDLYRRLAKLGKIKILWHIIIYESPRRFRKLGYWRVAWAWTRNGWSVLFRHRAVSKKWQRVD